MTRFTAARVFQILYHGRRGGEDVRELEQKYFRSQDRAHAEIDVSAEDTPVMERLERDMQDFQQCLAQEDWVQAYADEYGSGDQTTSLSQYALLASEASHQPRAQAAQSTTNKDPRTRQNLTLKLGSAPNNKVPSALNSKLPRSKGVSNIARVSGREVLAVHNSSYISAAVQFVAGALVHLFATNYYRQSTIDPEHFQACTRSFANDQGAGLSRFLDIFADLMKQRSQVTGDAIAPTALLDAVENLSQKRFGSHSAHTVHDFVIWLLSALVEGTPVSINNVSPDSHPDWHHIRDSMHQSPVLDKFGIHITLKTTCKVCNTEAQQNSHVMSLPVQFADEEAPANVSDLPLATLEDEAGRCSCGGVLTSSLAQVRGCSPCLIVRLTSFSTPVPKFKYPRRSLDLSKIISQPNSCLQNATSMLYELQSVVVRGITGYTTCSRYGDSWYQYNNMGIPNRVVEFVLVSYNGYSLDFC